VSTIIKLIDLTHSVQSLITNRTINVVRLQNRTHSKETFTAYLHVVYFTKLTVYRTIQRRRIWFNRYWAWKDLEGIGRCLTWGAVPTSACRNYGKSRNVCKGHVRSAGQTDLDLWHPTLGHGFHIKQLDPGTLPIESPAPDRRRTMVCAEHSLLYGDGVCFQWGTNWTVSTATSSQYLAVKCEPIV
jgi:hypothetical protein